jgi:phosphoribosylaminoimidazole-succinocarboxamide synthase
MAAELLYSDIRSLPLLKRGKVRDVYGVGEDHLLIVTTDRISAFDVVLPTPIPGKGRVLNALSVYWFRKLAHIVQNHLVPIAPETVVSAAERDQVQERAVVVSRLQPVPIEAVVRGYIEGSAWKEYQATQSICGIALAAGLRRADRFATPIFTPTTKAPGGTHDENIDFAAVERLCGAQLARRVRDIAVALYGAAVEHALARGIIIADTKFEFGLDGSGELFLIDEALTPDSSRFWPVATYRAGASPESFDKQFVRNWLESTHWDKQPPAPELPREVVVKTAEKYHEALVRLTGESAAPASAP